MFINKKNEDKKSRDTVPLNNFQVIGKEQIFFLRNIWYNEKLRKVGSQYCAYPDLELSQKY